MDNIDAFITNRLGEHQRKIDFIDRNLNRHSKTGSSFKKTSYAILSVAACLAIVLTVSPMLFKSNNISDISITAPSFTEYRGTSLNNIESLISSEQYERALLLVNSELTDINDELEKISSADMIEDEKVYMTSLYRGETEELIWSKIYLLVKLDRNDDLKHHCQNYLNNNEFIKHRLEVEDILKKNQ